MLTVEPPKNGHPLLDVRRPNFILTPHVAWASDGAMQFLADQLVDNIERVGGGQTAASGDLGGLIQCSAMMKKLLYQFDTDAHPSVFDNVVGYDGGADHISAYGGVNAANVGGLVEGAIFTRSPKDKKNTAIFIGGSNMPQGEAVLAATRAKFFAKFRVSVMFDCNGSNTTAAAAVAWLAHGRSLRGKRAVVLGGVRAGGSARRVVAGPRGRAGRHHGPQARRRPSRVRCHQARFGIAVQAIEAPTTPNGPRRFEGAHIVLATGASGITLLEEKQWQENAHLELIADANASPPAGIEGVGSSDRGCQKSRQNSLRRLGIRRAQAGAAPRLHRAFVRAKRSAARRRGNLWHRQRDGRTLDSTRINGYTSPVEEFLDELASARPRRAAAAPPPSWAPWARRWSPWCAMSRSARRDEGGRAGNERCATSPNRLRARLTAMVADDIAAFDGLMAAYRLPKSSDAEKSRRAEAIQANLRAATETPLACARVCAEVVALARRAAKRAIPGSSATRVSACWRPQRAAQRRAQCVHQCPSLKDRAYAERATAEIEKLVDHCAVETEAVFAIVRDKLNARR